MARYRKIDPRIWNDSKFRGLSDNGKLVFLFLLTHPHMTAVGAMRGSLAGLAAELEWKPEAFGKAFREASGKGMVRLDERAHFIWIPKFLKYNHPESPNVVKSWVNAIEYLPECDMKDELIQHIEKFLEAFDEAFRKAFAKAFPKASRKALPNHEHEHEHDLKTDRFLTVDTLSGEQKTDDSEKTGEECADALGTLKHARCVAFADIEKVLTHLNAKTGRNFAGKRPNGSETANAGYVRQVLKSGYDVATCIGVIDRKWREWSNEAHMVKFLRPSTLFCRKNFDTYVGELNAPKTASTARRDHQAPTPTKRTQPPMGALRGALKPGFKASSSPVLACSGDEQG